MNKTFLALALAVVAAGPAAASEQTDVMAGVRQFVDAFNKGDVKTAGALCAEETSILDEFPPYAWSGAGACSKWFADYDADATKNHITDGHVVLGKARHVDVAGDHAYVVVPATYTYKKNGKKVKETNAALTVVSQKTAAGWRFSGWAWAKP